MNGLTTQTSLVRHNVRCLPCELEAPHLGLVLICRPVSADLNAHGPRLTRTGRSTFPAPTQPGLASSDWIVVHSDITHFGLLPGYRRGVEESFEQLSAAGLRGIKG
jgi:hypothetical protein